MVDQHERAIANHREAEYSEEGLDVDGNVPDLFDVKGTERNDKPGAVKSRVQRQPTGGYNSGGTHLETAAGNFLELTLDLGLRYGVYTAR